jgi:DNA polymerase III subunit delta'
MADTMKAPALTGPQGLGSRAWTAPGAMDGLKQADVSGHFPPVLLLVVPRGEGSALLLDLAQSLLCPNSKDLLACGICPDCKRFAAGHPRLHWLLPQVSEEMAQKIEPYGPEWILKDPWTAAIPPVSAQIPVGGEGTDPTYPMMVAGVRGLAGRLAMSERENRVVLVPYADQLNQSSSNALLKLLEEPPDRTYFLLAASATERVLPTIRSRCFLQPVPPLSPARIEEFLKIRGVSESVAKEASTRCLGRVGAALALCSDESRAVRARAREWLGICRGSDAEKALSWIMECEELQAKDRRASQVLLETALGELEGGLASMDPRETESFERIRLGLEQALRAIAQHARPQMALTGAWLGIHA